MHALSTRDAAQLTCARVTYPDALRIALGDLPCVVSAVSSQQEPVHPWMAAETATKQQPTGCCLADDTGSVKDATMSAGGCDCADVGGTPTTVQPPADMVAAENADGISRYG